MLVIRTVSGTEFRVPLAEVESVIEIEPSTGMPREPPPHPYLHREGVNRCAACWRPRTDRSHTELATQG
jgi:hypothetical protein